MALDVPPLPQGQALVDPKTGQPSLAFTVYWQQVIGGIVNAVNALTVAQAALDAANAVMPGVAPITIAADYQGIVDPADQLPYEVAVKRFDGTDDVTTSAAWSLTVNNGDITASIGAATGILEITAIGSSGTLVVTSDYNGIVKTGLVTVTKAVAAPPSTGTGGGTTSSDTSFNSINSATHAAITDELTVTVGGSGTVTLSAPLTVRTARVEPTGIFKVWGKWQWWDGAAWQDVAAEIDSDHDSEVFYLDSFLSSSPGGLTVNTSKTGLTPAASVKFRLMARNDTGTRTMTFTGTASAVP